MRNPGDIVPLIYKNIALKKERKKLLILTTVFHIQGIDCKSENHDSKDKFEGHDSFVAKKQS